jgi:hypothetical protein
MRQARMGLRGLVDDIEGESRASGGRATCPAQRAGRSTIGVLGSAVAVAAERLDIFPTGI